MKNAVENIRELMATYEQGLPSTPTLPADLPAVFSEGMLEVGRMFQTDFPVLWEEDAGDMKNGEVIDETRKLRINLIAEEFGEYLEAEALNDITKIADALGDLCVVIIGAALAYGIPLDKVFAEIHRSNMSKMGEDGRPIKRPDDNKVIKGPNYTPPDIAGILSSAERSHKIYVNGKLITYTAPAHTDHLTYVQICKLAGIAPSQVPSVMYVSPDEDGSVVPGGVGPLMADAKYDVVVTNNA